MSSLFVRIWLAIWLVIVVVVFMSVGVFDYLRSTEREQLTSQVPPFERLQSLKRSLASAIESGETPEQWLLSVSTDEQPVYLLTDDGTDIAGRDLPVPVEAMLKAFGSRRPGGFGPGPRGRLMEPIRINGYPPLRLIAPWRPDRFSIRWFSPQMLVGLGFLVSGNRSGWACSLRDVPHQAAQGCQ